MRICIPVEIKALGGAHFFLAEWKRYLIGQEITVTHDLLDGCDILFLNSWLTSAEKVCVGMARNPRAHVIQRVDGAAQDYGRHDDADIRQAAVNQLTDLTIFQSAYSRYATREKFSLITQDGPVIHNPVDLERFSPDGPRQTLAGDQRIAYVSWSNNRLKGWPELYTVAEQNPGVDFFLVGHFPDPPTLSNLHLIGTLDRDTLSVLLRSCDALLTFSQNEACPNHVLEGLASGLPVLFVESGATPELVGDAGIPVTVDTFRTALATLWPKIEQIALRARERACEAFSPATLFQNYLDAVQQSRQHPPRIGVLRRWSLAMRSPRLFASMTVRRLIQR